MTLTIGGQEKTLHFGFRALRKLGLRGATDTEGLSKIITDAGESWEGLSRLLAAGLGRDPSEQYPDIDEFIDSLDYHSMTALMGGIAESLGMKADVQPAEGEQSVPPDQSKDGTSALQ